MATYQEIMKKLGQVQRFYGVTLDELAKELGVAKSTLSLAFRGLGRKWDYLERQKLQEVILRLASSSDRRSA